MGICCSGYHPQLPSSTIKRRVKINDTKLEVVHGDITAETTCAIVNYTNSSLVLGSGGIANNILLRGGISIQRECNKYIDNNGNASVGQVVTTTSGYLPCQKVLHIVCPSYTNETKAEVENIRMTLSKIFNVANENNIRSISLSGISESIQNFPKRLCARITYEEIINFLLNNIRTPVKLIRVIDEDNTVNKYFEEEFDKLGWQTKKVIKLEELIKFVN